MHEFFFLFEIILDDISLESTILVYLLATIEGCRLVLYYFGLPEETLVPTLDDLSGSEGEGEGLAAGDARVELRAVLQLALQGDQTVN